jgi:AcrR family transcriptional regulator
MADDERGSLSGNGCAVRRQVSKVARPAVRATAASVPRPRRRTQEERSAETRGRLIEAALQVLRESSYANLTINKVTQKAGVTNGAMQHHFGSRDDLILALLDAVYPVLQIPFEAIAAEGLPVRERVGRIVDLLWGIYSRPEYLAVWDIALGSRGDEAVWSRVQVYQQEIVARMSREFVALFPDLRIASREIENIFSLTVSYMRGVALQSIFGGDQAREVDLTRIKDLAYDQLMGAVADED